MNEMNLKAGMANIASILTNSLIKNIKFWGEKYKADKVFIYAQIYG